MLLCQLICFGPLQENQDLLIRCIAQHLGYAGNRPVAACIIYKCLLHWRSFEVERTSVFDRIIQTVGHAIEVIIMMQFSCYHVQHSSNIILLVLCRHKTTMKS